MQPLNLASSSVLKVFEHFDVDEFRSPLNSSLIRIVPTKAGRISAMQAGRALPHCEIYLLRTFPRIVDLEVPANQMVVLFSMVGTSDTIINGQPLDHPSLVLGRGPTDYRMVEDVQTCLAGIRFNSAMLDRGWPQTGGMFVVFRIMEPVLIELQFLMREMLATASSSPAQLATDAARQAAQETLLAALDKAFLDTNLLDVRRARSFQNSLHIVKHIDARLSANWGEAIYSDELASELRISVRTMHTAKDSRHEPSSVSSIEAAVGSKETVARQQQATADQGMRTFQWLLAYGRVRGPVCRPIRRSAVNDSGSRAAAAAMKSGATDRIRLGLGPKAHDNAQKATRSSRRIHGAACNYQRNWECMTVFYGR